MATRSCLLLFSLVLLLGVDLGPVLDDELVDVELALTAGVVHVPNLAEDGAFSPTLAVDKLMKMLCIYSKRYLFIKCYVSFSLTQ